MPGAGIPFVPRTIPVTTPVACGPAWTRRSASSSPFTRPILRDLELPEHILEEGISNVRLNPVQGFDAVFEMVRHLAQDLRFPIVFRFRCDGVGAPALGGIVARAQQS